LTAKDNVLTDTTRGRANTATVTAAVAHHVHDLRTARSWSLDELAGRSGVSKGMLVQVEGARTNPSVGTLVRIADAFGVTVARLFEPVSDQPVRIINAKDAPTLWEGGAGGFARLIAAANDPAFVELWEWVLEPGEGYASGRHAPATRELIHVLAGNIVVTTEGTDYAVPEGSTIDFLGGTPHSYRNLETTPARLVMVVIMPPGEWDRRAVPG
jgi:transcriptional regulator with XRE-family HTH domain